MMEKQLIHAWLRSGCYIKTVRLCYLGAYLEVKQCLWKALFGLKTYQSWKVQLQYRDFETVNCVISDGDLLGSQRMPLKCFIWTKSASCEQFSIAHLFKILSWRLWQLGNQLKMEASWLPEWLLAGSEMKWHNQVKAILCRNIHILSLQHQQVKAIWCRNIHILSFLLSVFQYDTHWERS